MTDDEIKIISLVYTMHNETGTGILNPIREIGLLAHKYGTFFIVDTISTYAMRPIDIEKDNIDFCMAFAQKGLMAMTGLSFVIGNIELIRKSAAYPKHSYYCNLFMQYHFFETTGQMHFTPPVQTIYTARQALDKYFREGEDSKRNRHLEVFEAIHVGLDKLGFKDIIKRDIQAGLGVTVKYPDDENWSFEKVHDLFVGIQQKGVDFMGKDLKGKELGVGISQRKDGLYTARFVSKRTDKSVQKYFPKLQECRKWYADAKFEDEHGGINASGDMTVTAWFDYWIENIKGDSIGPNTIRNYKERFEHNIKKCIGNMILSEVKPMHCQNVLNQMKDDYKSSTIYQTRITLYCMFSDAVENDVIYKNPVTKGIKHNIGKEPKKVRALTIDEQKKFLEVAEKSSDYNQFAFILQTGLRTGELIGLKWSDIDWEKRVIHIQRSMEYRYSVGEWRIGEPKSKSGYRDVPLTEEAVMILKRQKERLREIKVINMQFKEHVFLCRKGEPTKNSAYDTSLFKLCDKAGIRRFSMHVLRHTMATRCIEGGMRPKALQVILGHANVGITMNLYVDVTEEEKFKEVEKIESALKIV